MAGYRVFVWIDDSNTISRIMVHNNVLETQAWIRSLGELTEDITIRTAQRALLEVPVTHNVTIHKISTATEREVEKALTKYAQEFRVEVEEMSKVKRAKLRNKIATREAEAKLMPLPLGGDGQSTAESEDRNIEAADEPKEIRSVTVYTDASQSLDGSGGAVCGWVKHPNKDNTFEFDFLVTRWYDSNPLETLAILHAIVSFRDYDSITVYTDSQNGIKAALKVLAQVRNGGIINEPFLRHYIKKQELAEAAVSTRIKIEWVKGHSGNRWNECANYLVTSVRHDIDELFLFDRQELIDNAKDRITRWLKRNQDHKRKDSAVVIHHDEARKSES